MRREIFMGITAGATSPSPAIAAIAVNPLSKETTWSAILVQEGNGNGNGNGNGEPEWVKWALVGGGIILVALLAVPKKEKAP